MRKWTFISFTILLVIFEGFYLWSQKTSQQETLEESSSEHKESGPLQEQTLTDLYLVEARDKSKEWEVWADNAHKGMRSAAWNLKKVNAKFYSENVVYSVWGDEGLVNEDDKSMFIKGKVKLVSSNDYIFYTESLNYDPKKRQIVTLDKVSVEGPKQKQGRLYLEGRGLTVSLNTNLMILENEVKGHKPMSGKRVMSITSDKAEMSGKTQSASFKNNVLIKVDDMIVKGNFAKFQYKNRRLDRLIMDGGIHMKGRGKLGSAGMAIVYFTKDKYVFKKNSFVTQGENELFGDEITVLDGGKRVQVKNAKAKYHKMEKAK